MSFTGSDLFDKPKTCLRPLDKKRAASIRAELLEKLAEKGKDALKEVLEADTETLGFLEAAFELSPFLHQSALVRAETLASVLSCPLEERLRTDIGEARAVWRDADSEKYLMETLRQLRRQVALTLGLGDLAGILSAEQVTRSLTEFADACLSSVIDFGLKQLAASGKVELADTENPSSDSGLIVLGMGKFGAAELNYSSDIDIILLFDLSRSMTVSTDDPTSLFVRLARQVIRVLQERTGDGYIFRVDLRLRPDPGSTPLAIPVETAFNYYEAYGQNWERAAFIKARPVAGDIKAGRDFLDELAPFIWRKYMDFAAIQDVHSIKRQIHAHKGFGDIAVRGHNVKLGRGGIREIEFFVQTQQLIAGGRRESLRRIRTVDALAALREDGWIGAEAETALRDAYWYLRDVEHRIQMVADEQSHTLPEDDEGLERIARMMGNASAKEFAATLEPVMRSVETHYAALFEKAPQLTGKGGNLVFTGDEDDPATLETLSNMGFKKPSQIISTVKGWHYGRLHAVRTSQARELLTELTPSLIESFAEVSNSDESFFAFDRFLSGLPAGIQFFAILKSNPNLIRLLTLILGSAPRLAEIITRKPHVFDGLIDPSFSASIPERAELAVRLDRSLERADLYEAKLDIARQFAAEQKFLIGIRLLTGTVNGRQAGIAFTDLAEILLQAILDQVVKEFSRRHGHVAGGRIAILGMGRLGSRDLTAGSDLDLIFLYDHDAESDESDGEKPLAAQQYFFRLVQRLITAMSAPTAEGILYELDFRLRPSGNAGPLATQIDAFSRYQAKEAWVWESQALIRARPIAGDPEFLGEIRKTLDAIVAIPRDAATVTREIADMRGTLDAEKPPENEFDVKRVPGGLGDIEFISQWLALMEPERAAVLDDRSTLSAIRELGPDHLDAGEIETLVGSWELFTAMLQIHRVCLEGDLSVIAADKGLGLVLSEQLGLPDIDAISRELIDRQKAVRVIFERCIARVPKKKSSRD